MLNGKINDLCKKYGYKKCEKCPMFSACDIKKKDGENEKEFTERWEQGMNKTYKDLKGEN